MKRGQIYSRTGDAKRTRLETLIWDMMPEPARHLVMDMIIYEKTSTTQLRLVSKEWDTYVRAGIRCILLMCESNNEALHIFPNANDIRCRRVPRNMYFPNNIIRISITSVNTNAITPFLPENLEFMKWKGNDATKSTCLGGFYKRMAKIKSLRTLVISGKDDCCNNCIPTYGLLVNLKSFVLKKSNNIDMRIIKNILSLPLIEKVMFDRINIMNASWLKIFK